MCSLSSLFVSLFSFACFSSPATFAAALIVEFIFDWVLSWLLAVFSNWSAVHFVFKCSAVLIISGPCSSVGIATYYGLGGPASNPGGDEIFRPSKPALGCTQPPVKWVPCLSRGKVRPGRAADHSPLLVPRSSKSRAIPLPTLWAT